MSRRWVKSNDKCPRCKRYTEQLIDDIYVYAERCKLCGWRVNFTNDGPIVSGKEDQ